MRMAYYVPIGFRSSITWLLVNFLYSRLLRWVIQIIAALLKKRNAVSHKMYAMITNGAKNLTNETLFLLPFRL